MTKENIISCIGIIIGIIELGICIMPILKKNRTDLKHPFTEYDTSYAAKYAKKSHLVWVINWLVFCVITFIMIGASFNIFNHECFNDINSWDVFFFIIIQSITIGIKDLIHNKFVYKELAEQLFEKHFDNIDSTNLIVIIEAALILNVILLGPVHLIISVKKTFYILSIILSFFYCLFRFFEEINELLHLRKVESISIYLIDGTAYNEINEYLEYDDSVRITIDSHTIRYLSKNAISCITKNISNRRIIDIIRIKTKKAMHIQNGNSDTVSDGDSNM